MLADTCVRLCVYQATPVTGSVLKDEFLRFQENGLIEPRKYPKYVRNHGPGVCCGIALCAPDHSVAGLTQEAKEEVPSQVQGRTSLQGRYSGCRYGHCQLVSDSHRVFIMMCFSPLSHRFKMKHS